MAAIRYGCCVEVADTKKPLFVSAVFLIRLRPARGQASARGHGSAGNGGQEIGLPQAADDAARDAEPAGFLA